MEALLTYLVKSGGLIAAFWAAYFLLLRKETFFRTNRWYLLFGLLTSVVLPLITFKKVIWIDPAPEAINWTALPTQAAADPGFEINWWIVAAAIYSIGLAAFLFRFFGDFYALRRALKGKTVLQQADFKFVDTKDNISPFSYFNYIVYNSSLYSPAELQNILEHEKVHSDQHHSVDVLISRLFCIAFWFNPFVWLYKQSILQNLEFIADNEATRNLADKKSYQFTLLKVTAHENCVDITNHFYQSLIKKRIVMLNKNQSKKRNSWKYALIVPGLAAFMFYFQVKVIAQERDTTKVASVPVPALATVQDTDVVVHKNTSDSELKAYSERVKKEQGVTLKFSKVKRNSQGEITGIKAEFKSDNGKKGVTQISSDEPIAPIRFYKRDDGAIGFSSGRTDRIIHARVANREDGDDADFDFDFDVNTPEAPEPPEAPQSPADVDGVPPPNPPHPPRPPRNFKGDKQVIIRKGKGDPVVIIDGEVVVGKLDLENLDRLKSDGINITGDGDEKVIIVDGKKIDADVRRQVRESMERARPEIEKARREVERARIRLEDNDERISRREMDQARKEIENARAEINKAKADIEKQKQELEKERAQKK